MIFNSQELVYLRVWDRHVGRHLTRWKDAEQEMWVLAATLLEANGIGASF
jgi:hypothetical protein